MAKRRWFIYTKDNGDMTERDALVVAEPRTLYLAIDMTKLPEGAADALVHLFESAEDYKEELLSEWEKEYDVIFRNLWRSFKPAGIEWTDENV